MMWIEAQNEYSERSARPSRSNWVQGTSLVAIAQKTDHEVVFIPSQHPTLSAACGRGGLSWIHHHDRWFGGLEGIRFLYITGVPGEPGYDQGRWSYL